MKAITRSAGGAVLMLVMLPAIVGLLACLPVPIGDPERSRIDPAISGVWLQLSDNDSAFFAFEPYDKRTWLLTVVPIERGAQADPDGYALSDYAALDRLIKNKSVGDDGVTATSVTLFKVWRTKLGGEWFMTLEPKAAFESEDISPEAWFVFRIDGPDKNALNLRMVGGDLFKDVKETRRAFERVIKTNARNEALYDDEPVRLVRLQPEHAGFFEDLVDEVIKD